MRVAITGSTGFVGSNVASVLSEFGHEVVGLVRGEQELPWETNLVDFSSVKELAKALDGCDAVVHCAIANEFNRLMVDRIYAYDSFVGLTQRVVRASVLAGTRPIYISTDWVMDGTAHMALETEPGNPLNIYGFLKAMGEQVIRDLAPDTGSIARIGGVMGKHQTKSDGPRSQDVGFGYFVTSLVNELRAGRQFAVWGGDKVNKVATPSLASEIGAQVERIISLNEAGTFHLVSDEAIDRLGLARMAVEAFQLNPALLTEAEPPESEIFPAAVPVDTSLSNRETKRRLNLELTSIPDLLGALRVELESGRLSPLTTPR